VSCGGVILLRYDTVPAILDTRERDTVFFADAPRCPSVSLRIPNCLPEPAEQATDLDTRPGEGGSVRTESLILGLVARHHSPN
jgi:hypothetical protein